LWPFWGLFCGLFYALFRPFLGPLARPPCPSDAKASRASGARPLARPTNHGGPGGHCFCVLA